MPGSDLANRAVKFLIVAGFVVEAVLIFTLPSSGPPESDLLPESSGDSGAQINPGSPDVPALSNSPRPALDLVRAAEFHYRVPEGYEIERRDGVATLIGPGGDTSISIGETARGSVVSTSELLIAQAEREFNAVHISAARMSSINGMTARLLSGRAVNDSGARIYFRAVTVEGSEGNLAIAGFASPPRRTDLARALDVITDSLGRVAQRI
jgi:hypothetical protein